MLLLEEQQKLVHYQKPVLLLRYKKDCEWEQSASSLQLVDTQMQNSVPDFLTMLITLKCPLQCDHCIVDSGPKRSESLAKAKIIEVIHEAAQIGVKAIGFTGGDPFVRIGELEEFVKLCDSSDLLTVVVTSGFWASSERQAVRVMERLSSLHMLGISTDAYHQEFTNIENVENAVLAATRLSIPRIEVQVSYLDDSELRKIEDHFRKYPNVKVVGQRLWPVGRAAKYLDAEKLLSIDDIDLTCPSRGPVVMPNGDLVGCCSSLLNLGEKNPLQLGNLNEESVSSILVEAQKNLHYKFMMTFGLRSVVDMIYAGGKGNLLQEKYSDVCHLCHDIHSKHELAKIVTSIGEPTIERQGTD